VAAGSGSLDYVPGIKQCWRQLHFKLVRY